MYVLDCLQGFPEVLKMDQGGRDGGVLYDLPLILTDLGTKAFLWYKLVFSKNHTAFATHLGEDK